MVDETKPGSDDPARVLADYERILAEEWVQQLGLDMAKYDPSKNVNYTAEYDPPVRTREEYGTPYSLDEVWGVLKTHRTTMDPYHHALMCWMYCKLLRASQADEPTSSRRRTMKFGSDLLPLTATASDYAEFAKMYPDQVEELFALAIAQEREACAKMVEELGDGIFVVGPNVIHSLTIESIRYAAAIRARGKESDHAVPPSGS